MHNTNYWIWGYTMKKVPEKLPYMPEETYCSLETAANYFGAERVIYMNSSHSMDNYDDEQFKYIENIKEVIIAVTSDNRTIKEAAKRASEFSARHPNITGVVIDDFMDTPVGPASGFSVEDVKEIYENVKSANPDLKLWVVRYSRHPIEQIEPFLDYIDGIIWWVWVDTEHYWRYQYQLDLKKLGAYNKPVLQGVYLNNYGESYNKPVKLDMLKIIMPRVANAMKNNQDFYGVADVQGCVLLQNGWMGVESHREQVQWLKNFVDFHRGTTTVRNEDN